MNEEFLKKKQIKLGVDIAELKEKWSEFEKSGKEIGFEGPELEEHVRFRINKYYLKLEREPIIEGSFQPLSVDKTDYGIMRQYTKAIEAFNTDSEGAVKDGLVTTAGIPIQQSGFNKGKVIDLNTAFTIMYEGFFILKDKSEKVKAKFRLGGSDVNSISFILGDIYDVKGIKSQKAQQDGSVLIIGKAEYQPVHKKVRDYNEVRKDLAEYFEGSLVNIQKLEAYTKSKTDEGISYPMAVVRGSVYNINLIADKQEGDILIERNNRIELMIEDEDMNIYTVGGWVPKIPELEFDFSENAQNVILVGTVKTREDKNTNSLVTEFSKVTGIYVPKEFRKTGNEKPVEDTVEVSEDDVKAFVDSEAEKLKEQNII